MDSREERTGSCGSWRKGSSRAASVPPPAWPQGSQAARVPVSCHKEEQAGRGAGGRWGSRQECHLHDHPRIDGDTGTDTGTAPMDVPPRRGLRQLL